MFRKTNKIDRDFNSIYIIMDYQVFIKQHGDLIIMNNDEIPSLIRSLQECYDEWRMYKERKKNEELTKYTETIKQGLI